MTDNHAAEVQAELQQYLNTKNINSLFISIVENLLIEKPANPIAFIIEFLYKQHPDQAKPALDTIFPHGSSAESKAMGKSESKASAAGKKEAAKDEDSEDEEEGDVADIPVVAAPKKQTGGNRRVSVSAESMDPNKLKAQMSQVTNIPKSPEVTEKLLSVVSKSPLLRTLDAEQKDMIVRAFSGPLTLDEGADVIKQGDIGDTFYLLESGSVDVYIKKHGMDEMKVHTYKPGDSFGELAIMYNTPRAATCRVSTQAVLWQLDRISFKVIVVAQAMQKREQYRSFLMQVPILETLTEKEILTLADSLAEEKYEDNDIICAQGDEGHYFYIIKDGKADCLQTDAAGDQKLVASLSSGNYFGEIALLTPKPRQATVKANGKLSVLAIDKATFTRVFGDMEEIMKRNMDKYIRYASQAI